MRVSVSTWPGATKLSPEIEKQLFDKAFLEAISLLPSSPKTLCFSE
jgi:hypothetical protein